MTNNNRPAGAEQGRAQPGQKLFGSLNLHFIELSAYHLKVTLSAFGLASEILIGLANQKKTFEIVS